MTWAAAMSVILDRDGGDLARTRRLGQAPAGDRDQAAGRCGAGGTSRAGGSSASCSRPWPIRPGCIAHRPGALERVALLLQDWDHAQRRQADTETRMLTVLDELGLTGAGHLDHRPVRDRRCGDPGRDRRPAPVRHRPCAGQARRLAPREKLSGTFTGRTKLTGQGRPGLRLAAWRAVWGAQRSNPVYRTRYQHLTSREQNKLRPTQAQTVVAAAILRHLYAVITTGQAWDPVIATHGKRRQVLPAAA